MYYNQIRPALEKALGSPVNDEMWGYLVELGCVESVEIDAEDINYLADHARKIIAAGGGGSRGREKPSMISRPITPPVRTEIYSVLLAQRAAQETDIVNFRNEVLGETLLEVSQVEDWIRTQAKADGPETIWLKVPVTPESRLEDPVEPAPQGSITPQLMTDSGGFKWILEPTESVVGSVEVMYIEYGVPDKSWLQLQAVAAGGVLERLWRICRFPLVFKFPWTTGQAAMFVLTGLCPEVRGIEIRWMMPKVAPASRRIIMEIDLTIPADEVLAEYKRIRKEVFPRGHRSLSEKHMRLAVFDDDRLEGESWAEKMRAWNKRYPEGEFKRYSYDNVDVFRRDAKQAGEHLFNLTYEFDWDVLQPDMARLLQQ